MMFQLNFVVLALQMRHQHSQNRSTASGCGYHRSIYSILCPASLRHKLGHMARGICSSLLTIPWDETSVKSSVIYRARKKQSCATTIKLQVFRGVRPLFHTIRVILGALNSLLWVSQQGHWCVLSFRLWYYWLLTFISFKWEQMFGVNKMHSADCSHELHEHSEQREKIHHFFLRLRMWESAKIIILLWNA